MTEGSKKLADLGPEQRKLLALRLRMQKAKESAPAAGQREGGVFPLSFAQRRMWLLDRLEPGATAYHLAFASRLRGPLDASALERALGEIVRLFRIADEQTCSFDWNRRPAQITAVEVNGMVGLPKGRDELVHDPGANTRKLVLCFLTDLCKDLAVGFMAGQ